MFPPLQPGVITCQPAVSNLHLSQTGPIKHPLLLSSSQTPGSRLQMTPPGRPLPPSLAMAADSRRLTSSQDPPKLTPIWTHSPSVTSTAPSPWTPSPTPARRVSAASGRKWLFFYRMVIRLWLQGCVWKCNFFFFLSSCSSQSQLRPRYQYFGRSSVRELRQPSVSPALGSRCVRAGLRAHGGRQAVSHGGTARGALLGFSLELVFMSPTNLMCFVF